MTDNSGTFREKLFAAQEMTPTLREEYRRELEMLMYEKPTVQSRMNAWSSQSRSIMIWSTPANSAASRPGLTGRYRSHVRAIGVIRGS